MLRFRNLVLPELLTVTDSPRDADRALVDRYKGRDAAAERVLYDAHVERVYRLAHRMAGDADLAADITQETFMRAFDRLAQYRGESSLATWLHSITMSVALNALRKVKRFPEQPSRRLRRWTRQHRESPRLCIDDGRDDSPRPQ
jgi:RNA polymerase sigma factor (sigma-70 family)